MNDLSPEARKAKEEARIRELLYSELCECGHQRRRHGRVKCFGDDTCRCRAFKPASPSPTQQEALR